MTFNTLATLRQMLLSADILHLVDGHVYLYPHQDIIIVAALWGLWIHR